MPQHGMLLVKNFRKIMITKCSFCQNAAIKDTLICMENVGNPDDECSNFIGISHAETSVRIDEMLERFGRPLCG